MREPSSCSSRNFQRQWSSPRSTIVTRVASVACDTKFFDYVIFKKRPRSTDFTDQRSFHFSEQSRQSLFHDDVTRHPCPWGGHLPDGPRELRNHTLAIVCRRRCSWVFHGYRSKVLALGFGAHLPRRGADVVDVADSLSKRTSHGNPVVPPTGAGGDRGQRDGARDPLPVPHRAQAVFASLRSGALLCSLWALCCAAPRFSLLLCFVVLCSALFCSALPPFLPLSLLRPKVCGSSFPARNPDCTGDDSDISIYK